MAERGRPVAAEADGAEHPVLASDRRQRLVGGAAFRAGDEAAEQAFVGSDQAAQHRLAVAHPGQGSRDGGREVRLAEDDVRAIGLEQRHASGVVADHLLALVEDQVENLLHRFAGGFLHELVHERVARGFLARKGDCVSTGQLGSGPQREGPREPAIVLGEASLLVPKEHKPAYVLTDRHRDRHQAVDA